MSVERYLLASALTGIISQRLAKRLCPKCRKKKETNPYEKKVFKLALDKDVNEIYEADPKGCEECTNGYRGRIAVHEVLEIDDHIRNLINNEEVEKDELREKVYSSKTITLLQDGLMKVLDGRTSFDEIFRIIDIDNDIDDSEISVEKEIEDREKAAEENKTSGETPTEEEKTEDAPSEEKTPAVEEKQTTLSSPNLATDANELEKKEG